jgi:hypothetical protein
MASGSRWFPRSEQVFVLVLLWAPWLSERAGEAWVWVQASCAARRPRPASMHSVNVPGHVVQVDTVKYEAMKRALLRVLPLAPAGMTQTVMRLRVTAFLHQDEFPGGRKTIGGPSACNSTWRPKGSSAVTRGHAPTLAPDRAMRRFLSVATVLAWLFGAALLFAPAAFYVPTGMLLTPMLATLAQAHRATLIGLVGADVNPPLFDGGMADLRQRQQR